ncbi:YbjQ family protein [Brachyspira hampsonii]|uniref:YbjQ family protein n=1 Tax=Brachyspira hampsonii TaxID=1287055 RepID=UPI00215A021D|nr:YbjQ family protein [Brachyspira hampsonii]
MFTVNYLNANYEILELVKINIYLAKLVMKDLLAGLKNIVSSEIKSYTEMLNKS